MLREPVLISTVTTIPGVRDRMLKVSFAVNGEGADLLRVRMGRELAMWKELIEQAGLKPH